jgi:mono/diheme cytochrome c family protein
MKSNWLLAAVCVSAAIAMRGLAVIDAAGQQQPHSDPPIERTVLDKYCVACHNDRLKTGNLSLEGLDVRNVPARADVWERVVRKLKGRAMPPAGRPRPDASTYDALVGYFEGALDGDAIAHPNPGRPSTVHRLNRFEYVNAIRDLLAVNVEDIDVNGPPMLPADDAGFGFDNIGDALSISPLLLERYLAAARKISRFAIGDLAVGSIAATYTVSADLEQPARMSEDLPFGSRGGTAIRHTFPVDGEYVIEVRMQRNLHGNIKGIAERDQLEIRIDGVWVGAFALGGERRGKTRGIISSENNGDPADFVQDEYERTADNDLHVRVAAKAGSHVVAVYFVGRSPSGEGVRLGRSTGYAQATDKSGQMGVGAVTIAGPESVVGRGDTPSRRRIFVCRPTLPRDEGACARTILTTLARRAYRRAPAAAEIDTLMEFYASGRREGSFDDGVQDALERLLVDPNFLLRIERDPPGIAPGTPYRLSDLSLASRLSFFLWSSIPDDELTEVAARGGLKDPPTLERQVRRMLADPRAESLVTNFAGQWLWLRNAKQHRPNRDIYFDFDDNLREAFVREAELFVGSIMREDRSILDLISAEYTFLNERLAKHYGIPGVYGNHFRRVTLPESSPRRGLMGKGAILMVTSHSNRTSPVVRGRWLLENILASPPPPPPPNVPALPEPAGGQRLQTMRERLQQHRANPVCAACHAPMDPLGFALEAFDGIGTLRSVENGVPVDASAALPDGTTFEGPAGLRALLERRSDDFIVAFTEKMLTYALGRGLDYYDAPAVRRIVRESKAANYRWSTIVVNIVNGPPFLMRRSAP